MRITNDETFSPLKIVMPARNTPVTINIEANIMDNLSHIPERPNSLRVDFRYFPNNSQ